jgi:hypothetical protein
MRLLTSNHEPGSKFHYSGILLQIKTRELPPPSKSFGAIGWFPQLPPATAPDFGAEGGL